MAEFNTEIVTDTGRARQDCGIYLQGCLSKEEHEKLIEDWKAAGGFEMIPFWKFAFENIEVFYNGRVVGKKESAKDGGKGKPMKFPISPKTPIYSIEYCCGKNSNNKAGLCYKGRCEECESKSYYILEATAESSCKIFEIGKSVFFTKEEAEAALKELERGKGE